MCADALEARVLVRSSVATEALERVKVIGYLISLERGVGYAGNLRDSARSLRKSLLTPRLSETTAAPMAVVTIPPQDRGARPYFFLK